MLQNNLRRVIVLHGHGKKSHHPQLFHFIFSFFFARYNEKSKNEDKAFVFIFKHNGRATRSGYFLSEVVSLINVTQGHSCVAALEKG